MKKRRRKNKLKWELDSEQGRATDISINGRRFALHRPSAAAVLQRIAQHRMAKAVGR